MICSLLGRNISLLYSRVSKDSTFPMISMAMAISGMFIMFISRCNCMQQKCKNKKIYKIIVISLIVLGFGSLYCAAVKIKNLNDSQEEISNAFMANFLLTLVLVINLSHLGFDKKDTNDKMNNSQIEANNPDKMDHKKGSCCSYCHCQTDEENLNQYMILILIIFAMVSAYLFKDQGFYLLQKDGQLEGSIKSILSTYFTPSRFSLFCFCTAFAILTNYNSESKFCFKICNVDEQYYNAANYHFMLLIVLALSLVIGLLCNAIDIKLITMDNNRMMISYFDKFLRTPRKLNKHRELFLAEMSSCKDYLTTISDSRQQAGDDEVLEGEIDEDSLIAAITNLKLQLNSLDQLLNRKLCKKIKKLRKPIMLISDVYSSASESSSRGPPLQKSKQANYKASLAFFLLFLYVLIFFPFNEGVHQKKVENDEVNEEFEKI